jgi:ABC-type branched-subunit amino acid transport system substrate-binding protein
MVRGINRRDIVKGIGAGTTISVAGCIGNPGDGTGTGDGGSGPDVLVVIGYPKSGNQLFRDYYSNTDANHDILVPDGLRDANLPSKVGNDMKNLTGTAPGAAGPNRDAYVSMFNSEYGEDPGVFTPHTFDSMAVQILANALAGKNDGEVVRNQIRRVSQDSGMEVGPDNLAEGVEAAANGNDVKYEGASSPVDFDKRGDPAAATYNIWKFKNKEVEETDSLEFTGNPGGKMYSAGSGGTGRTAKVGILLPETGDLGSLGKPMINAANLAAKKANEQSAIDIETQVEDTQTDRAASLSGADALINAGYPSVCGPASSGNNIPVSKEKYIKGNVVGCSPSSTALTVSFLDDNDYVFRTAPSDLLQGQVMAKVAADNLSGATASTLYVNNDYGQQLSDQFVETFKNEHDGKIWNKVAFNKNESSYTSVINSALENPN